MASGDLLAVFTAMGAELPASGYATPDTRNAIAVLDFDAATDEAAFWHSVLPANYAGGGLTVKISWMATSATSGDCYWQSAIERMNTDLDSDSYATAQSGNGTANGTSGIITTTSITHSSGANMDSLAAGEPYRLKINRDADNASDSMTGDAEIVAVHVYET